MPRWLPYSVFKEPTLVRGADRLPNPASDVKRNLPIFQRFPRISIGRFRLPSEPPNPPDLPSSAAICPNDLTSRLIPDLGPRELRYLFSYRIITRPFRPLPPPLCFPMNFLSRIRQQPPRRPFHSGLSRGFSLRNRSPSDLRTRHFHPPGSVVSGPFNPSPLPLIPPLPPRLFRLTHRRRWDTKPVTSAAARTEVAIDSNLSKTWRLLLPPPDHPFSHHRRNSPRRELPLVGPRGRRSHPRLAAPPTRDPFVSSHRGAPG